MNYPPGFVRAFYWRDTMQKKEQTARELAFVEHLRAEGFTEDEMAWEDEQPMIRQARRSFNAGWAARHKVHEVHEVLV